METLRRAVSNSEFSERTYVETGLDAILCHEIADGRVSLVILCGNAGDGKTAFLQHLAIQLGFLQRFSSSQRVWETRLANGITVKANLDGAAAWRGRSADDLLDEIFAPFHDGIPKERIIHLVAVNDGRLMEWIESYELRHGPSRLTNQLDETLGRDFSYSKTCMCASLSSIYVRWWVVFPLARSGLTNSSTTCLRTSWEARNLRSYGGRAFPVRLNSDAARGGASPGAGEDRSVQSHGALLRERLTIALQMVHQRNEVHITTRELKATLSYILFGTRYCADLHTERTSPRASLGPRVRPCSPLRQGRCSGNWRGSTRHLKLTRGSTDIF